MEKRKKRIDNGEGCQGWLRSPAFSGGGDQREIP